MIPSGGHKIPRFATGAAAMILALYFIHQQRADWIVLAASSFLFLICASDTLFSKIPNLYNLLLLLFALGYHGYMKGMGGLQFALLGLLVGMALFLIPFIMGGMGAGDVKALAALGALLGPAAIFQVFIYTGILGGLLGLLQCFFSQQIREKLMQWLRCLFAGLVSAPPVQNSHGKSLRFPFAAAIAFGYFSYLTWGSVINI